jgi:hypothetical protein
MRKAMRVLAIITVVASLVQVFDLVVEVIRPDYAPDGSTYAQTAAASARVRWMVYWPSGLFIFFIAYFVRKKAALLGNSLLIGGVYLMLLGNNGGIWSTGQEIGRLVTSIVTLAILIWVTIRLDKTSISSYESQNNDVQPKVNRVIEFGEDE